MLIKDQLDSASIHGTIILSISYNLNWDLYVILLLVYDKKVISAQLIWLPRIVIWPWKPKTSRIYSCVCDTVFYAMWSLQVISRYLHYRCSWGDHNFHFRTPKVTFLLQENMPGVSIIFHYNRLLRIASNSVEIHEKTFITVMRDHQNMKYLLNRLRHHV